MTAPSESPEELREHLLALRQDYDDLAHAHAHAAQLLDALESLLIHSGEDPFARVFDSLRKVFTFSQAAMLVEPESSAAPADRLTCIVADPEALVGSCWPVGALFRKVMRGRVITTFSNEHCEEWQGDHVGPLSAGQSALYLPVRVREQRGILMLLRDAGAEGFRRSHVGQAKRFSVLVSHALATRFATESAEEKQQLRELTEQLRSSERAAMRNLNLLDEIVNVLPVGVAVHDERCALQVVNDVAARALGRRSEDLLGTAVYPLFGHGHDTSGFERLIEDGIQRTRETQVFIGDELHTMLVTDKPVRILDESLLVSTTLDITERKRFEDELSRQAFHDQLTGLPNRALMQEIVDTAIKANQRGGDFALAFIDLDNFKNINDYYSHALGDLLLRAVAERISSAVRPGDTLGRISGDEFLLLINPLKDRDRLAGIIDRVIEALKQPFDLEGHQVFTSASIGASLFPHHGTTYEALRRCADNAMYRAKSDRKGSAKYFDIAMAHTLTARMELEQHLRTAIREGHFTTAYQSKVSIRTGDILGFEALCRWVEPDGTIHGPGSFIDLATELGLLDEITHFVLDDVVRDLPALREAFGDHTTTSLNIGARQAGDIAFMESVISRLERSDVAPHVVLELTEDALVATQRFQNHVLPRLRRMGVRVSIDDFGTGFSSLSVLADITADEVKVDRAFITEIQERPRSQGILKAIESLCRALAIEVVAEGVETAEELGYLREHTSIGSAQGYYFCRPQFLDQLLTMSTTAADVLIDASPAPTRPRST